MERFFALIKMKTSFLLIFLSLSSISLAQNNAEDRFYEGNQAYENGKYVEALEIYQSLIDEDFQSFELFYNTGNAAYQEKKWAKSILNYERAKRLQPNNEDVIHNLKLANTKTVDKIDEVQEIFFKNWYKSWVSSKHPDAWSSVGISLFFVALLLMILFLFSKNISLKKAGFFGAILAILMALGSITFAFSGKSMLETHNEAIIFSGRVSVKASPNSNAKDLFVLHEGTKVVVLEENETWLRIRIADGNDGWLKKSHLEVI